MTAGLLGYLYVLITAAIVVVSSHWYVNNNTEVGLVRAYICTGGSNSICTLINSTLPLLLGRGVCAPAFDALVCVPTQRSTFLRTRPRSRSMSVWLRLGSP